MSARESLRAFAVVVPLTGVVASVHADSIDYILSWDSVSGSLGDTSFENRSMTITFPGSTGSVYTQSESSYHEFDTHWYLGPTDVRLTIGGGVVTNGTVGGVNLRLAATEGTIYMEGWYNYSFYSTFGGFTWTGGDVPVSEMLTTEWSANGTSTVGMWNTIFTDSMGWVNGMELDLELQSSSGSWQVVMPSTSVPVPGFAGMAAFGVMGLARRRRHR